MSGPSRWIALATLIVAFGGGFIAYLWLPSVLAEPGQGLFAAWCSAWGVPGNWAAARPKIPMKPTSDVVLSHQLLANTQPDDIGRGATLALRCTMCHGPTGISYANSPNLAGQYAVVVYKELRDYKSGARTHNAIMTPMAKSLSDEQMRQLAVYYASLPRLARPKIGRSAPAIVKWGAPMRNIAPCGACHGDIDHTMAGPWLGGEPAAYIDSQLTAFASGERRNDINEQMRDVARAMTPQERAQASEFYSEQEK